MFGIHIGIVGGGQGGFADYPFSWSEPAYDPPAFSSSTQDWVRMLTDGDNIVIATDKYYPMQ